jgi:hypothetical protein
MVDELARHEQCWEENNWYLRCTCDQNVQILDSYKHQKCVNCKEIENLKSDLGEFNNILGIANRQAVKEAIRVEINILLGKIESVKA